MKLESITIKAAHPWEKWTGYRGEIKFAGRLGEVQIQVGEDLSQRILGECAAEIVAAAKQVATEMTTNIIEQVEQPALEARRVGDST